MKATVPIGIQPGTKILQIGFEPAHKAEPPHWTLWLHHDKLMTQGTFLKLYPCGKMERVTVSADGTEDVARIR